MFSHCYISPEKVKNLKGHFFYFIGNEIGGTNKKFRETSTKLFAFCKKIIKTID